jgi:hypothetical protein
MEFWTPLDERFCWRQTLEEFRNGPRLYTYPVTEYPTTFLRLYQALIDISKIQDSFIINLHYANLKGYILLPYTPNTMRFLHLFSNIKLFDNQHLTIHKIKVYDDLIQIKLLIV